MDWTEQIQNAIDYIEERLEEKIDYAEVAKRAYASSYHFQRVFGILCGLTLGEYIRRRRLSKAVGDLLAGEKVLEVAVKYGYESSESFSRAFFKFHGVLPSALKRGDAVKNFAKLSLKKDQRGGTPLNCKIIEQSEKRLVGFGKRFHGVPYGKERLMQEDAFYSSTRGKQWLLIGAAGTPQADYAIVTNLDDEGYDFYIAYELDEWTERAIFDPSITGMDLQDAGFEVLLLPKQTCAVFCTEQSTHPIADYTDLRRRIVTEWLPQSDFRFAEGPEVVKLHWRNGEREKRFVEIALPIERKAYEQTK